MSKIKCKDHLGNEYNSIKEMCNNYDISINTFDNRIKRGWSLEKALTVNNICYKKCKDHLGNEYDSIKDMCNHWGISVSAFRKRIEYEWSLEDSLTKSVSKKRLKKCKDHLGNEYDSIKEMCTIYNITVTTFDKRIETGYTLEEALTMEDPRFKKCKDHLGNEYDSKKDMCKCYGIPRELFNYRIKKGWSLKDALLIKEDRRSNICKDHLGREFGSINDMCKKYNIVPSSYRYRMKSGYSIYEALEIIPIICKDTRNLKLTDNLLIINPIIKYRKAIAFHCEYNNSFVILTHDEIIKIYEEEMGFTPKS